MRAPLRGVFLFLLLLLAEGAGFGFEYRFGDREDGNVFFPFSSLNLGGDVSAAFRGFIDDFDPPSDLGESNKLWDILSGRVRFSVLGPYADGVVNLNFAPVYDGSAPPVAIDEAYIRLHFGPLQLEGGVRKIFWGKADSFGPLDVINPLDYTNLGSVADLADRKIPRPLLRVSWGRGFSKLEAVLVPSLQPHRFETGPADRWTPLRMGSYSGTLENKFMALLAPIFRGQIPPDLSPDFYDQGNLTGGIGKIVKFYEDKYRNVSLKSLYPPTDTVNYSQAGLRFTTTIGPADLGIQYFFGNLFRPALTVSGLEDFYRDPYGVEIRTVFNRYHQIGLDYAQILAGFSIRAEAAAHITEDLRGDRGDVYNPFLGWSLGFDRELPWAVNLNFQGTGTIRLFHNRLGEDPLTDTEAGTNPTATRIILLLSRNFFRDRLELKALGLWGLEDRDFFIGPGLVWMPLDALSLELSGGVYLGNEEGELGQYHKNNMVKLILTYSF